MFRCDDVNKPRGGEYEGGHNLRPRRDWHDFRIAGWGGKPPASRFSVKHSLLKESPEGHWRVLLPVMLAATIVVASGQPVSPVLAEFMCKADKVVHFCVFGVMALLIARLRFVQEKMPLGAMSAIVIVSVFGITDELHQAFTPGRVCDFGDWAADVLGAVTFVTAYVHWDACRRWLEHRVVVREGLRFRIRLPRFAVS